MQLWALICLLRAAEASGAYLFCHRRECHAVVAGKSKGGSSGVGTRVAVRGGNDVVALEETAKLSAAWRSAWGTLLGADQRLSNLTSRCERGGLGEAVVAVLGTCMRERLVESAFVTKEQVRSCCVETVESRCCKEHDRKPLLTKIPCGHLRGLLSGR